MPIPKVLVIAGSDSSGGAGLEADQKTLATHGVYAMTTTTALTAQNTQGVTDIHITPSGFVEKQIRAVMDDGFLDNEAGIVKMGMLASADTVNIIAQTLHEYQQKTSNDIKLVVDPVMIATSGAQLLPGDAVRNLREKLLPMTFLLTPNIPEATLLLRDADIPYQTPTSLDGLLDLAKALHKLGPKHILLKGGHMPLDKNTQTRASDSADSSSKFIIDILSSNTSSPPQTFTSPFQPSPNTHGTGCSLASAIAANLALHPSQPLSTTIRSAITYVSAGISTSTSLSLSNYGPGPINHFHSTLPIPFAPSSFIDYLITHPLISPIWHLYTHHPFTAALATNTLPLSTFKNYLIQDYRYLTHFARTYALAASKSQKMSDIVACADIIKHIETEMRLHVEYCVEEFGLTQQEMEDAPESLVCTAYSRYVLDVGHSGDLLALYVSLAPCLVGYGVVAERLKGEREERTRKGGEGGGEMGGVVEKNRYWKWVENYTAEDYKAAVKKGREVIEDMVRRKGIGVGETLDELVEVFRRATELEVGFWELDAHVLKQEE